MDNSESAQSKQTDKNVSCTAKLEESCKGKKKKQL